MTNQLEKEELLAEEALVVRHSGELPEIAYHGSLYYLTEDPEGPKLSLSEQDRRMLKGQAVSRYQEIIRRDLAPENRGRTFCRGLNRAICNWKRLKDFCTRQEVAMTGMRQEVGAALVVFLHQEAADVNAGSRTPGINCSGAALEEFIRELGIEPGRLPDGWRNLCF